MQKKYLVSKEKKALFDAEEKKNKEQRDKIYDRLHDLRVKLPVTIYGNSERLIKLHDLIVNIKDVLDQFFAKKIATLSPKDMQKLSELHAQVVNLNKKIQANNYDQFKVIEDYMNDFLEQIDFINSTIEAMNKLNKKVGNIKLSSSGPKSSLSELEDKLQTTEKSLTEKKDLLKTISDDIQQMTIELMTYKSTIESTNEIIESNKQTNTPYADETKIIAETEKKLKELEEKILKKQEEDEKYEKEYNELVKQRLQITSAIEDIKKKKGGHKTRKNKKR